ncbi:prevent-host-death family protein [Phyllobacterium leguminum]|uniref:Antitoxin n=2 Tax=Phyllobacterium leguminum TaxID=314237 RepID=A0A318T6W8_9HYPH|nr:type II toxin-antitoxin system prevent-host-death family antitoxin [Phyllobacterium leguminum]PYE88143.1 prevent-host-death family protein [Phyllobacterium leguminum]
MPITTLSSHELSRHLGRARRAAKDGPVIITNWGKPAHVLMSFDEYKRLTGKKKTLGELLAYPGTEDVELPLPDCSELAKPIDMS